VKDKHRDPFFKMATANAVALTSGGVLLLLGLSAGVDLYRRQPQTLLAHMPRVSHG